MNQDDAKVWMGYSETDLRAAHVLLDSGDFFPRQICFLAQQCGGKANKAFWFLKMCIFQKTTILIGYET